MSQWDNGGGDNFWTWVSLAVILSLWIIAMTADYYTR